MGIMNAKVAASAAFHLLLSDSAHCREFLAWNHFFGLQQPFMVGLAIKNLHLCPPLAK